MAVSDFIKDQDLFGKSVQLNFNKKGSHNTSIGGIVSLFLKLLMSSFVVILIKALILYEKDDNTMVVKISEIQDLPEVWNNETNYTPQFSLIDMRYFPGPGGAVKYDEDFKRYFTIKITSFYQDYSVNPPVIKTYDVGLRECNIDDY